MYCFSRVYTIGNRKSRDENDFFSLYFNGLRFPKTVKNVDCVRERERIETLNLLNSSEERPDYNPIQKKFLLQISKNNSKVDFDVQ